MTNIFNCDSILTEKNDRSPIYLKNSLYLKQSVSRSLVIKRCPSCFRLLGAGQTCLQWRTGLWHFYGFQNRPAQCTSALYIQHTNWRLHAGEDQRHIYNQHLNMESRKTHDTVSPCGILYVLGGAGGRPAVLPSLIWRSCDWTQHVGGAELLRRRLETVVIGKARLGDLCCGQRLGRRDKGSGRSGEAESRFPLILGGRARGAQTSCSGQPQSQTRWDMCLHRNCLTPPYQNGRRSVSPTVIGVVCSYILTRFSAAG